MFSMIVSSADSNDLIISEKCRVYKTDLEQKSCMLKSLINSLPVTNMEKNDVLSIEKKLYKLLKNK
jgi:hypothetical protein